MGKQSCLFKQGKEMVAQPEPAGPDQLFSKGTTSNQGQPKQEFGPLAWAAAFQGCCMGCRT